MGQERCWLIYEFKGTQNLGGGDLGSWLQILGFSFPSHVSSPWVFLVGWRMAEGPRAGTGRGGVCRGHFGRACVARRHFLHMLGTASQEGGGSRLAAGHVIHRATPGAGRVLPAETAACLPALVSPSVKG